MKHSRRVSWQQIFAAESDLISSTHHYLPAHRQFHFNMPRKYRTAPDAVTENMSELSTLTFLMNHHVIFLNEGNMV